MSTFFVKQFPVLSFDQIPGDIKPSIIERVTELCYFNHDLDGWMYELWNDEAMTDDVRTALLVRLAECNGLCFDSNQLATPDFSLMSPYIYNEERRAVAQAELDAIFAHLYGLTTEELRYILGVLDGVGLGNELQFDLTLARGLNYYTGAIFEVKALDVQIGSITGGGRYDNLTGIFGMPGLSGVGISFGADRIYDVLNALDLYPKNAMTGTQLMFINFGAKETAYCLPIIAKARSCGIATEMYPDAAKMKKQMNYANVNGIAYVALAGENEINEGKVTLKNMVTGGQQLVDADELVSIVNGGK